MDKELKKSKVDKLTSLVTKNRNLKPEKITIVQFQSLLSEIKKNIIEKSKHLDEVDIYEKLGGRIYIFYFSGVFNIYISNIDIIIDQDNDGADNCLNIIDIDLGARNIMVTIKNITARRKRDDSREVNQLNINVNKCLGFYMTGCDFSNIDVYFSIFPGNKGLKIMGVIEINHYIYIDTSKFRILKLMYKDISSEGNSWITTVNGNTIEKDLIIQHNTSDMHVLLLYIWGNRVNDSLILDLYNGKDKRSDGYLLDFSRSNKIKNMDINKSYPKIIEWGLRESIGEDIFADTYNVESSSLPEELSKEYREISEEQGGRKSRMLVVKNKVVLTKFKEMAINDHNKLQENAINYNITKCDEQLLNYERGFKQEKIVMWLGKELSDHGTSWILPLLWILVLNVYVALAIYTTMDINYTSILKELDLLYIWGQLQNPLIRPLDITQGIDQSFDYKKLGGAFIFISSLVVISKGFFAMCIYEFVRAARRFTLK